MLKIRIILFGIAIALTILLFSLPRTMVKNPDDEGIRTEGVSEGPLNFSASELREIAFLTENFRNSTSMEKSAIFADSLAALYAEKGVYDSAGWYFGWIADRTNNIPAALKAGNFYYEAFETAPSQEDASRYGVLARDYLEQYLQQDPKNADAKAKVAMTYVATDNAMKGINMLVEVVGEHPDNETALFNLGVLSMQISQYPKAAERFEKLIDINPGHVNAHFYLGVSYMEMKRDAEAREQFQKAKSLSTDPEVAAAVDGYLEQLKNK